MAAWTIAAGLFGASALAGSDDEMPSTAENKVNLVLQINGLGPSGGQVEIKPGHKGCKFKPVVKTIPAVPSGKPAMLEGIAIIAQSTGADRDCSFAITIKEPGQKPITYRRGLRLAKAEDDSSRPEQTLKCYLSTSSIASRDDAPPKQ
jgi:hypothetical protein